MSLFILLGDYGSGKTTTAKYLAKDRGGVHLRSEMLTRGSTPLVDKLKAIIKPNNDYYLDGWNGNYHFEDLPELLNTEVRYIVCMGSPTRIQQAQKRKGIKPRTADEIRITTQHAASIALTYDNGAIFADTTKQPVTFHSRNVWLTVWMEINLYEQLNGKGEYQDVELSDYTIPGLSRSHLTWDRLTSVIDFNGKSVCDYGCNLGYFSFKAEEAGASSVTAVDVSPSVLATARSIAMVKHSKVHFVIADLTKYWPHQADIIMALNILHHLNYNRKVLLRIFNLAGTVVIEMPAKDLNTVNPVAQKYQFETTVIGSHREGRCIAIYSRNWKPVVPERYEYHLKRAQLKWWAINMASKYLPFKGLKRRVWKKISS